LLGMFTRTNCTILSSLTGNHGRYTASKIAKTYTTENSHKKNTRTKKIRMVRGEIEKGICPTMHRSANIFCLDYLSLVIFLKNSIRRKQIFM
jgi:hypothetical protein